MDSHLVALSLVPSSLQLSVTPDLAVLSIKLDDGHSGQSTEEDQHGRLQLLQLLLDHLRAGTICKLETGDRVVHDVGTFRKLADDRSNHPQRLGLVEFERVIARLDVDLVCDLED